jgi:hypothetical protein
LRKWLRLVRREGLNIDTKYDTRHYVICSKQFIDGKPTPGNPYPTLFDYNNYKTTATPRKTTTTKNPTEEAVNPRNNNYAP